MKLYAFILSVSIAGVVAPAPNVNKQYRSDYEYNQKTNAFYKLHITQEFYGRAKPICELEGAKLMVPATPADVAQVHGMMKRFPDLGNLVWVAEDGLSHDSAEEKPLIDLEPSTDFPTYTTNRNCDVVTRKGAIETAFCYQRLPFVCKVDLKDAPYDSKCHVYGTRYQYFATAHSCYKIGDYAYTWNEAFAECRAEGAHLVVLNSPTEHQAVWDLLQTAPTIQHADTNYFFHAGIRANKPTDGSTRVFRTIFNETLNEAGYNEWSDGEPNNHNDSEYCGSIFKNNGKYNDINCASKYGYVCEKEVSP